MSDADFDDDDADWDEDEEGGWDDDDNMSMDQNNEDEEISWDIEVENLYYTAESQIKSNPESAMDTFLKCIKLEEENSPNAVQYRFNSLKHVVLLLFNAGSDKKQEMVKQYEKMLSISHMASPNDVNTAIRRILNIIHDQDKDEEHDDEIILIGDDIEEEPSTMEEMYNITLVFEIYSLVIKFFRVFSKTKQKFFKNQKGKERVWFEFAMKLCKTYLDSKKMTDCEKLLDELHESCRLNGNDDPAKGSQLLEIYSIKIQLVAAANNRVALAELFERTNQLCADVNDPRSMSVIKECWGKMYASMNQWDEAYANFFDAFRSYSDIGHANVKQCLKYTVIASMLSKAGTNPFAAQEASVFVGDLQIMPMVIMLKSFEDGNILRFQAELRRDMCQ